MKLLAELREGLGISWDAVRANKMRSTLATLGLEGRVLVVLSRDDITAIHSFNNLDYVKTIDAGEINAYDVLDCDWILFTDETLPSAKEND